MYGDRASGHEGLEIMISYGDKSSIIEHTVWSRPLRFFYCVGLGSEVC